MLQEGNYDPAERQREINRAREQGEVTTIATPHQQRAFYVIETFEP